MRESVLPQGHERRDYMEGKENMTFTVEQFAEYCECSMSSMLKNMKRNIDKVEAQGKFTVTKTGRGKTTIFTLEPVQKTQEKTHKNIDSIFNQAKKDLQMNKELLNLEQLEFAILVLLLSNEHQTYRGYLDDWTKEICKILDMKPRKENYEKILETVRQLELKNIVWVHFELDRLSVMLRDRIIANGLLFDSDMISYSKEIAADFGLRSWVSVLKVWLACRVITLNGEYTGALGKVRSMTGLSNKTTSKIVNALTDAGAFRTKKLFNRDTDGKILNRYGTFIEECGWLSKY